MTQDHRSKAKAAAAKEAQDKELQRQRAEDELALLKAKRDRGELTLTAVPQGLESILNTKKDIAVPFLNADDFEFGDDLGSGGIADVFRAENTRKDNGVPQNVAIKRIQETAKLGSTLAGDLANAVRQEAEVYAQVNHPAYPQIFGTFSDTHRGREQQHLVMEVIEGPDVADLISLGYTPENVLDIAEQLLDATSALHAIGKVNRDIKPSNIKIQEDGRVRILDMGCSTDRREATFADTRAMGSWKYVAPEIIAGDASVTSDIYSSGLVLYELFMGEILPSTELHESYKLLDFNALKQRISSQTNNCVATHIADLVRDMTFADLTARIQTADEAKEKILLAKELLKDPVVLTTTIAQEGLSLPLDSTEWYLPDRDAVEVAKLAWATAKNQVRAAGKKFLDQYEEANTLDERDLTIVNACREAIDENVPLPSEFDLPERTVYGFSRKEINGLYAIFDTRRASTSDITTITDPYFRSALAKASELGIDALQLKTVVRNLPLEERMDLADIDIWEIRREIALGRHSERVKKIQSEYVGNYSVLGWLNDPRNMALALYFEEKGLSLGDNINRNTVTVHEEWGRNLPAKRVSVDKVFKDIVQGTTTVLGTIIGVEVCLPAGLAISGTIGICGGYIGFFVGEVLNEGVDKFNHWRTRNELSGTATLRYSARDIWEGINDLLDVVPKDSIATLLEDSAKFSQEQDPEMALYNLRANYLEKQIAKVSLCKSEVYKKLGDFEGELELHWFVPRQREMYREIAQGLFQEKGVEWNEEFDAWVDEEFYELPFQRYSEGIFQKYEASPSTFFISNFKESYKELSQLQAVTEVVGAEWNQERVNSILQKVQEKNMIHYEGLYTKREFKPSTMRYALDKLQKDIMAAGLEWDQARANRIIVNCEKYYLGDDQ